MLNSSVFKDCTRLILLYKVGFDGATGQSVCKQKSDDTSKLNTDESLFITCLVPLELYCFKDDKKQVVWRNPKPSSTSYCRPLRFKYRKESKEVVLAEYESIMASIKNITLSIVSVLLEDGTMKEVELQHIVNLTRIDGKIQTIISTATNSYQFCSVCGASPIEMNNLSLVVQKKTLEGNIRHGVSTLDAWIRFLECMLHISCKMPNMK